MGESMRGPQSAAIALRARIVLAAAAGRNSAQIVRNLVLDIGMARRWLGL